MRALAAALTVVAVFAVFALLILQHERQKKKLHDRMAYFSQAARPEQALRQQAAKPSFKERFLASVRDEATQGPSEEVDLGALVGLIVEDAGRGGQAVRLIARPAPGQVLLTCRPDSLRRALEILIGNAMRYGRKAEVSLRRAGDWAVITVEDDGPGIPEERYEEALKPFTRLDPARNQDRGQGVGLGLSIAADIARGHGGGLKLGRSARMGGLQVEMRLPL